MRVRWLVVAILTVALGYLAGALILDYASASLSDSDGTILQSGRQRSVCLNDLQSRRIIIFDEKQDFALPRAIQVNLPPVVGRTYDTQAEIRNTVIPAGTVVSSHLLHLDRQASLGNGAPGSLVATGTVRFDTEILGVVVMDNRLSTDDELLGAGPAPRPCTTLNTNCPLLAQGTCYPIGLNLRGLEFGTNADVVTYLGPRRLRVQFDVPRAMDEIRVITRGVQPATPTFTATFTPTQTPTDTATPTPTDTAVPTETATPTPTETVVPTDTATDTPTETAVPTETATPTPTDTVVPTETATPTPTDTVVPTETATPTPTDTVVPTETATPIPTETVVPTDTATHTPTDTVVPTETATPTATETVVPTDTATPTATETVVPTDTATPTPTDTVVVTETATPTPTDTVVVTETATPTPTDTVVVTETATPTPTDTIVPAETATPTPTETETSTNTATPTGIDTVTPTPTATPIVTPVEPAGMALDGPATMAVGETVQLTVSAAPAPAGGVAGYNTEVFLPAGLKWVQRAACSDEILASHSGGQQPGVCARASGQHGEVRHVVITGVALPLVAFDSPLTTLVQVDITCNAAGTYKAVLTALVAGAPFGAVYFSTNALPINVATTPQEVDVDGDTGVDYTAVADGLTITCIASETATPVWTSTTTATPVSTSTTTATATPSLTVAPTDAPPVTPGGPTIPLPDTGLGLGGQAALSTAAGDQSGGWSGTVALALAALCVTFLAAIGAVWHRLFKRRR